MGNFDFSLLECNVIVPWLVGSNVFFEFGQHGKLLGKFIYDASKYVKCHMSNWNLNMLINKDTNI